MNGPVAAARNRVRIPHCEEFHTAVHGPNRCPGLTAARPCPANLNWRAAERYTSPVEPFVANRPSTTVALIVTLLAAGVCLSMPGARAAAHLQREARERHVYVSVTGDNDEPVSGLTVADFVVRENDLAREVIRVTPAPPPTHVALIVDDGASMTNAVRELRQGASAVVKR